MKIRRRVEKGAKEVTENVELVKENSKTVWVKLSNGDIINRKKKDIV